MFLCTRLSLPSPASFYLRFSRVLTHIKLSTWIITITLMRHCVEFISELQCEMCDVRDAMEDDLEQSIPTNMRHKAAHNINSNVVWVSLVLGSLACLPVFALT